MTITVSGSTLTFSDSTTQTTAAASSNFSTINSNTSAISGSLYLADTSSGSFTITLPSSPSTGATVYIQDSAGKFSKNYLFINPNGKTVMGSSANVSVTTNYIGFGLVYNGSDWRVY